MVVNLVRSGRKQP